MLYVGTVPVSGVDHAARESEARYQLRINGYRLSGERWERGEYVARVIGSAAALAIVVYRADPRAVEAREQRLLTNAAAWAAREW